jgi:hypothetical protein
MGRQWKEIGLARHHVGGDGGGSLVEEFASLVFMLCAVLVTLSLFAAIIFFCADGVSKTSTKASGATANNYAGGSACAAAGCGAGCGGGCGGWPLYIISSNYISSSSVSQFYETLVKIV